MKCKECSVDAEPGYARCRDHLNRINSRIARIYAERKKAGKCTRHGCERPLGTTRFGRPSTSLCDVHLAENREFAALGPKRNRITGG